MGFAVYHTEKGKTSSGGIGNHIDRKIGAAHTYQHADPSLLHLNKHFKVNDYCYMPLHKAIAERIKEGYKGKKGLRSDAVKYQTHILTGSHEDMKKIFSNEKVAQSWIKKNLEFLSQEYGRENIVRFVLHLDEKTPHIHAVTIPITSDGRLSAKEIVGNKKTMQERQDRYAEAMKGFNLERGLKSTGIKHESAREYYSRIEEALEIVNKGDLKAEKNFLGVYKEESVKALESAVSALKMTIYTEKRNKEIKERTRNAIDNTKVTDKLKFKVVELEKQNKRLLIDDDYRERLKLQNESQKMVNKISNNRGRNR